MRKILIVLGLIAAVLALILAATPFSNTAYIPAITALVFGFIAFYIAKRDQSPKKTIQLIFLLTLLALVLTTYKVIFNPSVVEHVEKSELKEKTPVKDSEDRLEEVDVEHIETDAPKMDLMESNTFKSRENLLDQ